MARRFKLTLKTRFGKSPKTKAGIRMKKEINTGLRKLKRTIKRGF